MFKKEEEENENEEEKKMRRRPFKYAKAMRMMMRKGGKEELTDEDENVDGEDREATTRITCASQNGVACALDLQTEICSSRMPRLVNGWRCLKSPPKMMMMTTATAKTTNNKNNNNNNSIVHLV